MYKVSLVHTVPSVYATFAGKIKEVINDVKIVNTVDEYLASDPAEKGVFTIDNMNRLLSIIKCAEMIEPNAIVVTCSTLSPAVEKIRPFIKVPLITIDEAMIIKAVELGTRITILATADSTIGPTKTKLLSEAKKLNKEIEISVEVCPEAYIAIKAGDQQFHDEDVKRRASEIKGQDVIILAQASMAHLEEEIAEICACTAVSSPKYCIEQLKNTLCR
ncbi:aspartate/glutamate racemase family protein [Petroclostridium sp. X23]|uniref:aspartate/glutamate racemase family protein n=1 Tax=Petroclostridium sp. X23 TaxID=3045146 RepID=UPI0024ACB9F7|nr:aspartate/glutamate racemase family protein [Petroclostridium sp. X23]WHH61491.1 aspartate/glutamate racemase family protein [Petroclostridium sp. X23]